MKCLILAAGYATRLYPLTENFPKPLLKVGDKTILDWLIEDLDKTGLIDEYIVVTNHKFASIFEDWAAEHNVMPGHDSSVMPGSDSSVMPGHDRASISVIDDGTSTNETRLGAVKDIALGIHSRNVDEDLLVMAGDNLLTFSLQGFLDYARAKGTTCIMRFYQPDENKLHKCGVAEVGENDLILSMEEKPANPKSHWCCPPFYYYRKEDLPLVDTGIAEGCGTDAPGSFIAWLCTRTPVHAWPMPGDRLDIGNLESYEEAKRMFSSCPA